jgi:hypothetical protein
MPETEQDLLRARVARVRERIAAASERAGREPGGVRLVAATKTIQPTRIREAIAAGISDFGENYVQEARDKAPAVVAGSASAAVSVRWHMIGHLQSNKAKYAVDIFSLIHSVDTYQLAQELGKLALKKGKSQEILIEVNLAGTPERAGVAPEAALALAERVAGQPGLSLMGLMGMAPFSDDAEDARPHFRALRALWDRLPEPHRRVLSMGMSGDFEVAIEEGSTLVRIGTALFGQRGAPG